eukprot:CAMPEP_0197842692 /NCGR_PEP_ID=MMETSP1437-20131217/46884_1 /TAXON_ID=49252 ORGANISM="Eucampia antarctica, Strain CCMP1452" /NCGR_SAMPLE_ID=MMETSP1437 /ASSEMBLY_ACC=CAM_ASM_001096 /LENGTH=296 /DNA_ID=CAMNT_0043452607 /DNA_START=1659 /DNA_END=2549 /DNA_ORIENTATION=+
MTSVLLLRRDVHLPVKIKKNVGVDTANALEKLGKARTDRIRAFLNAFQTASLKFYSGYYNVDARASLETEDNEFALFGEYLYYIHMLLMTWCRGLRVIKNVIAWRSSSKAYVVTVGSFLVGIILMLLPWGSLILWTCRILAWSLFGPWMKLFDLFLMQHHYGVILQSTGEIKEKEPVDVDSFFQSPEMKKLAKMVRIAAEDSLKLKQMREHLYGSFSEVVPNVDTSRFPSLPLPTSTAITYRTHSEALGYQYRNDVEIENLPGQRLRGRMIHTRHDDFFCDEINVEDSDSDDMVMD